MPTAMWFQFLQDKASPMLVTGIPTFLVSPISACHLYCCLLPVVAFK